MDTQLPSQDQIVRQLAADGEESFAKFFVNVRERLRRIALFRLDYRLRGRVSESDIIQETYVRAAQRIERYLSKPEFPFFVWLRMELQQHLVDVHRRHFNAEKRDLRRERIHPASQAGPTSVAMAAQLVAQMTSASQLLERAEQIETLERALAAMNELDREVIALRHFEELSNMETAEILGIEPSAASKRYLRALQRMRQIFEQLHGTNK